MHGGRAYWSRMSFRGLPSVCKSFEEMRSCESTLSLLSSRLNESARTSGARGLRSLLPDYKGRAKRYGNGISRPGCLSSVQQSNESSRTFVPDYTTYPKTSNPESLRIRRTDPCLRKQNPTTTDSTSIRPGRTRSSFRGCRMRGARPSRM